jgi:glycosyltransferase involved in cell wall biosynthesis
VEKDRVEDPGIDGVVDVSICVVTYRRPASLARLLERLGTLRFRRGVQPTLEVLVVDNDHERSARSVCEEMSRASTLPIRYATEPRRGIAIARNTAVRLVRDRCAFVVFIDDDEEPDEHWIDELLWVQRTHTADVVSGPVLPRFEAPPPAWLRDADFFDRLRYPTGAVPRFGATNNVLVRAELFRGTTSPFDERLGLTGGEDTLFFLRTARDGRRHVWADTAIVFEWLPPSRVQPRWLLRREFRKGISLSYCERQLRGWLGSLVQRLPKALARIVVGIVSLPIAAMRGRAATVRALRHVWYGAGSIAGLAGASYEEYRVTHGR